MEDDLHTGATIEESPFGEVMEIQRKRVLDALEMATLQAINDVRENFKDLSDTDEVFFGARLQGEILEDALTRYMDLTKRLAEKEDIRAGILKDALSERLNHALTEQLKN